MSLVASSVLSKRLSSSKRSLRVASFFVIEGFIANFFQKRLLRWLHLQRFAVLNILSSTFHLRRLVLLFETKFALFLYLVKLAQQRFQLRPIITNAGIKRVARAMQKFISEG